MVGVADVVRDLATLGACDPPESLRRTAIGRAGGGYLPPLNPPPMPLDGHRLGLEDPSLTLPRLRRTAFGGSEVRHPPLPLTHP